MTTGAISDSGAVKYTLTVDISSVNGGVVSQTQTKNVDPNIVNNFVLSDASLANQTIKISVTLPEGESLTQQVIDSMVSLAHQAGAIKGFIGALGDSEFTIGNPSGDPRVSFTLNATDKSALRSIINNSVAAAKNGTLNKTAFQFGGFVNELIGRGINVTGGDIEALIEYVLRESYMQTTEDLRFFAEKVKFFNAEKKAIRAHMAKLREISSKLATVPEDERGSTGLDGQPTSGSGATGGAGNINNAPPVYSTPEKRFEDNPEASNLVNEFLRFTDGTSDATELEKYLKDAPEIQERLLKAIPYMTPQELATMVVALGGKDLNLSDDYLKGYMVKVVNAMTDGQILAMAEVTPDQYAGKDNKRMVDLDHSSSEFTDIYHARLQQALNSVGYDIDSTDYAGAAKAWSEKQLRATGKSIDETAGTSIDELLEKNASGTITAAEMVELIKKATEDFDAHAASVEFDDLKAFIDKNEGRLSDGAKAIFAKYETLAKECKDKGMTGIPVDKWDAMIAEIEADAAKEPPIIEDTDDDDEVAPDPALSIQYNSADFDLDPDDGSIDAVFISDSPPFIRVDSSRKLETCADLDNELKSLEDKLNTVGDDAQLANVDLQNSLQKQQQTLTMMSNIFKMFFDTGMNTIRKIGA
ncbi:MAG: hypothetical protein JW841_17735 [Deltaproteobacteria bacterium]|nr:hypothetical protein [Deltaproteobacteria bacterium]